MVEFVITLLAKFWGVAYCLTELDTVATRHQTENNNDKIIVRRIQKLKTMQTNDIMYTTRTLRDQHHIKLHFILLNSMCRLQADNRRLTKDDK